MQEEVYRRFTGNYPKKSYTLQKTKALYKKNVFYFLSLPMFKLRLGRPFCHFLLINFLFLLTYKVRLWTDLIPWVQLPIPFINATELAIFSLIASAGFIGIGIIKDFYCLNKRVINHFQTFSKTWIYWFISITFLSYFGQGFIFFFGISRFILIFTGILTYLVLFFFDQAWRAIEYQQQKKSGRKILIISSETIDTYEVLKTIKANFSLKTEFITPDEAEEIDFAQYEMCVVVGTFNKDQLQAIFEKTRFHDTRFFHISEGFFLEDVVYKPEIIQNIVALEYKHSKLDGRSLVVKRVFDLVGSFFGIIFLSPLLLMIAIAIKLDSKGPVIYKSKRVGTGGQLFTFLKFRTMYTHLSVGYGGKEAEDLYKKLINSDANTREGVLPKIENDPRVTRVGRFLRKTSLDELPQLFSVFWGTMSLVGPRPHLENEVAKYTSWQKRLLSIKPWITGYAQVFGRDSLSFDQEAKLDLYYIQNWTLWLDIYVIVGTFGVIFKGR